MLTMQAVARAMISITFIGRSPESHQKHERDSGQSPKVCFSRDSYPVNRRAVRFLDGVMPAPVAGIHALSDERKDVDGRDKPGHDGDSQAWW